jgi:MFS family permease
LHPNEATAVDERVEQVATVELRAPGRAQSSALLVAVALLTLGNGLLSTVVGVRGGLEGMAQATIGVVMSAFFAGFVAGSIWAPGLVQTVGHIRTFAALASIASAASLGFVLLVEPVFWVVLRAVAGACYAGMVIVVESWLNASADRARRGRVLAAYGVIFYGAWAASQPLLNLAPASGFALFCLVSILLSLALVPITLTRAGVPGVVEADRARLARLFEISPLGLAGAFALGVAMSAYWGMAPSFGQAVGMSEATISLFLTTTLLGALAAQWPLGWLSDRTDRRRVIVAATVSAGLVAVGLALVVDHAWAFIGLAVLLGGAAMPIYALCVAHVNDQIETREVVAASSALILVYGVGSAIGPFGASLVMDAVGPRGLFVFMAAALGAFALYAARRLVVSPPPPPEAKESWVSVPQTSHAVLPLHEHSPEATAGRRAPQ